MLYVLCSSIRGKIIGTDRGTYGKAQGIRYVVLQTRTHNFMNGENYQWRVYAKNGDGS